MLGTFEEEQEKHCVLIEMSRGYSGRKSGNQGVGIRRGILWITKTC